MSLGHQKYPRQQHAKEDMQQTMFYQNPSNQVDFKGNPNKYAKIEEKKIDYTKKVTCPFCLSWMPLNHFLISGKKGINKGLGKCSECGAGMRLKTLFALGSWTPEEYAKFVVEYPYGAFFAKINKNFGAWKARLQLMKWSERFWLEYRRLNPKLEDEKEVSPEENEDWNAYDREQTKKEFERRQAEYQETAPT